MSFHTWSRISLSCHSFRLSDISADSSCNLIISPREIHSAIRATTPAGLISNSHFCEVTFQIVRLRIIALHHVRSSHFSVPRVHEFFELLAQSSLLFGGSCMWLLHVLRHFFQISCAAFSSSLSLRSCFKVFLSLPLSQSPTLASSAILSDTVHMSVYLFELSSQLLAQVFFFSFTSVPSSSTSWEISFNLARSFELFHLSCELCPASSTAERCQLDFEFQSFDDQPACLWDIARLSTAMFFLPFDTGLRLGQDEDADVETRIISLETKGPISFRVFSHLH